MAPRIRVYRWYIPVSMILLLALLHVRTQTLETPTKPSTLANFDPLPKAPNGLPDYYKVFGLDIKTFSIPRLKKAYRKLSLVYHPDRQPKEHEAQAKKKFIDITTGYTILLNDEKRATYDASLSRSDIQHDFSPSSDPSESITNWLEEVFLKEAQASAEELIKDAFGRVEDVFKQFAEFGDDTDDDTDGEYLGRDDDDDQDSDRKRKSRDDFDETKFETQHTHEDRGLNDFLKGFFEDEINDLKEYFKSFAASNEQSDNSHSRSHRDEL